MQNNSVRTCVVGAGSWGTGIVALLGAAGESRVQWYCRDSGQALAINRDRANPAHFADVPLPECVYATSDVSEALDGCDVVYLVVAAAGVRDVIETHRPAWELWQDLNQALGHKAVLCNCSKGLLADPTERSDEWLAAALPRAEVVHLSGPNLAAEIVRAQPAAAVVASSSEAFARRVQAQLASERFRVYTGEDLIGVEVAGFYKNIIAIASGMADGLKLGNNTRAVLITRGLAEMGRLVEHFGGKASTLHGLAGVGDLIVTCSSPLSRNFQVGQRRVSGQTLQQIEREMTETAEGVNTSRALWDLPGVAAMDLPIAAQVYRVLHEGLDPKEAITELMLRPAKAE
jgi:glycerol-3-phosphate dehydrogenase (NAD(P)+)